MPLWRHLRAILLLPCMATVVVPAIVVGARGADDGWPRAPALATATTVLGVAIAALGLALVGTTIRHFATLGAGTLAPWDPTRRLVVVGPYRHVRNPMISGVLAILVGEALALGSQPLFVWAGLFFIANALYIPLVEERGLIRRFGDDYRVYRRHVPRWIPRVRPWTPPT